MYFPSSGGSGGTKDASPFVVKVKKHAKVPKKKLIEKENSIIA